MTDKKFVPFDYQRYLDGDEVYYRNGNKFEGEIFKSQLSTQYPFIIRHYHLVNPECYDESGHLNSDTKENSYDLVMLPKIKKLWIAIDTDAMPGCSPDISCLYDSLEKLKQNCSYDFLNDKYVKIIEIEIEA